MRRTNSARHRGRFASWNLAACEQHRPTDMLLSLDYSRRRRLAALRNPEAFPEADGEHQNFDEFLRQADLMRSVPAATWVRPVRWLSRRPFRTALFRMRRARQRMERGWDDSALWNLDVTICRTLAAQLRALGEQAHGWPDQRYETFAQWQEQLLVNASKLEAYENVHLGGDDTEEAEKRRVRDAQQALHWIAENLTALWG